MLVPSTARLFRQRRFSLLVLCGLLAASGIAAFAAEPDKSLSEDDIRWREKMGWNPQVHDSRRLDAVTKILARAPYAYYPSANEIELLFDYTEVIKPLSDKVYDHPNMKRLDNEQAVKTLPADLPAEPPTAITLRVLPAEGGDAVFTQSIPLDAAGRGYGRFTLPAFVKGTYRVEYDLGGGRVIRSNRPFTRSFFEFEGNDIGEIHDVFAPFTPVEVEGRTVAVVDRRYTLNPQGLFQSVVAKDRDLLAEPMRLVVELADGRQVEWKPAGQAGGVAGRATHPDTAVFQCAARGDGLGLESWVTIEEDGCAKVEMQLGPDATGGKKVAIRRAWLRMALKESEAPLCHMVGLNSMRHNYAGNVPRGGTITWINQPWRPGRFEVKPFDGPPPDEYEVWDGRQQMHWGSEFWNFTPYVWLGAEERGLAWFGDHTAGYETDGQRGIQRLRIEPGKVVLHVELIQQPVTLDAPRTFVFGLQGSPTKPMMDGWRGYAVPGGGGMSVVVWGGYNCASHYPDPKDWRIVEKIVSARDPEVNKNVWKGPFKEFFETLDTQRQFPDLKVLGREDWLKNVLGFASRSRRSPNGITVYYEEFQTSGLHPETYEYMDEWDLGSWCRFRKFNFEGKPYPDSRGWGPEARTANQESWRDFAVYYADEWMKRGVGIYYDNTMPHTDFNRFTLRQPGVDWQSCLWGHREYFRRVWKRSRELMAKGLTPIDPYDPANPRPMRLHIVGHVTNCQVLPYTTWWDATLGVESPGQWLPDTIPPRSPEEQQRIDKRGFVVLGGPSKDNPGQALPYPPDYLRAMEMGRMAGLISHSRHSLRSDDAFGGLGVGYGSTDKPPEDVAYHRRLSDKAMNLVHEIRGGGSPYDHDDLRTMMAAFELFGYGQPATTIHNYWSEKPFLKVGNPAIKWIALERPAAGPGEPVLALLQSYDAEACSTGLDLPKGTAVLDLFTRQLAPASEPLHFAADYGTRLVLLGDRGRLASLAWAEGVVLRGDFELGLPPGWKSRGAAAPQIVTDPQDSANHVLRITPAHPSQHFVSGETAGDETLSLRFRLPALTEKPPYPQFYGVLQLLKRQVGGWPKQSGQMLQVGIQNNKDGNPALALTYTTRREGTIEPFGNVTTDRLAETGTLVPLDDAWHTLSVTVAGTRHTLAIDGVELFSGETDVTDGGALVIGPGWGSWSPGFIDIDELVVRR